MSNTEEQQVREHIEEREAHAPIHMGPCGGAFSQLAYWCQVCAKSRDCYYQWGLGANKP